MSNTDGAKDILRLVRLDLTMELEHAKKAKDNAEQTYNTACKLSPAEPFREMVVEIAWKRLVVLSHRVVTVDGDLAVVVKDLEWLGTHP